MKLELEPLDDDEERARLLSPEEREQMLARIKPIPPEALKRFDAEQRHQIQTFFYRLIALSEQVHHDMEDTKHLAEHEAHMVKLHGMRRRLFEKASPVLNEFIHLVDLSAMEPWLEWEVFLNTLRREMEKEFYETKNTAGQAAALDNPFLLQVDDNSDEEQLALKKQSRLTPRDIEQLIFHFSLEDLVKYLIQSRKVITGQFWERDYDL